MGFTPFVCHAVARVRERDVPTPLLAVAGKRAGPRVTRMRELALSHTIFHAWERGPYTPRGQHTTADSIVGGGGAGESALKE